MNGACSHQRRQNFVTINVNFFSAIYMHMAHVRHLLKALYELFFEYQVILLLRILKGDDAFQSK